jgi:hypothetical protein
LTLLGSIATLTSRALADVATGVELRESHPESRIATHAAARE